MLQNNLIGVFIALSCSLVASLLVSELVSPGVQNILPIALSGALIFLLILYSLQLQKLAYLVEALKNPSAQATPKETLKNELIFSLLRYGYIQSHSNERRIRELLDDGQYIRHGTIFSLLDKGSLASKHKLRCINDHPFPPFTAMMVSNASPETQHIGITAIPDDHYELPDIERRLALKDQLNVEYYMMPAEDIHIGFVIFDADAALICPSPATRTVGSFSEALLFTSTRSVKEAILMFDHIRAIAKRREKENGEAFELLRQWKLSLELKSGHPNSR